MLETLSIILNGVATPAMFAVTTSTGYRAELPACRREHEEGFTSCIRAVDERHMHAGMSVDAWLKHCRTHCHDFHLPLAEKFRDKVMATYVSA